MAYPRHDGNRHIISEDDIDVRKEYAVIREVRNDPRPSIHRPELAAMLDIQAKFESLAAENAILKREKARAEIAALDARSSLSRKDEEIDGHKPSLVSLTKRFKLNLRHGEILGKMNEESSSFLENEDEDEDGDGDEIERFIKLIETLNDEISTLKEEKKNMIQTHNHETFQLRQKFVALTKHLQKIETAEHLEKSETIPPEGAQIDTVKTDEVNEQERGTSEQLATQNISLQARVTELEAVVAQLMREKQNEPSDMGLWEIRKTRDIVAVIVDVMNGNLDCEIAIQPEENREVANLKTSVNQLVSRLRDFYDEVWSVFREPSIEGSFHSLSRSQASATKPKNIWKELTDNVNQMAGTMTAQLRCISHSLQAVSQGDFNQKITEEASGEFLVLKEHTNHMIDMMNSMVTEVTKVSNDVAVDGVLGGSVNVGQLQGEWKKMVDGVNTIAEVLTQQTRMVSDLAVRVKNGNFIVTLPTLGPGEGELQLMRFRLTEMVIDLRDNWTRGTGEVRKVDSDKKSQEERLERIWAILQSNI